MDISYLLSYLLKIFYLPAINHDNSGNKLYLERFKTSIQSHGIRNVLWEEIIFKEDSKEIIAALGIYIKYIRNKKMLA